MVVFVIDIIINHVVGAFMEGEWTKTFEVTKVESYWSWCPDMGNAGIAIIYSVAFIVTLKIVIQFFIFLRKKNAKTICEKCEKTS